MSQEQKPLSDLERATEFGQEFACERSASVLAQGAADLIAEIRANTLQNPENSNASEERVTPIDWPSDEEITAEALKFAPLCPVCGEGSPYATFIDGANWLGARIEGKL